MAHGIDKANQGSFLSLSSHTGGTPIAPEHLRFPKLANPPTVAEAPFTDLAERNRAMRLIIDTLGLMSETAPAADYGHDEDVTLVYDKRFGAKAPFIASARSAKNTNAHELYDGVSADKTGQIKPREGMFRALWGLEAVKKSGLFDAAEIKRLYSDDRHNFEAEYSKSPESEFTAPKHRKEARAMLDKQERAYRKQNVGVWEARPDIDKLIKEYRLEKRAAEEIRRKR